MNLRERVIDIIAKNKKEGNVKEYLKDNDDLTALKINSIDFIRMIIDFEGEFNVTFADEALYYKNFLSLQILCDYIQGLIDEN